MNVRPSGSTVGVPGSRLACGLRRVDRGRPRFVVSWFTRDLFRECPSLHRPPPRLKSFERAPEPSAASPSLPRSLADAERDAIIAALRESEGRISGPAGAARLLGVKPTTLHAKMKRLGVRRRDALTP
jgi:transcriptional regulator with GAF, ATPase, and Fis domain